MDAPEILFLTDATIGVVAVEPPAMLDDIRIFGSVERKDVPEDEWGSVAECRVDGWIVVASGLPAHVLRALSQHGSPVLFLVDEETGPRMLRQVKKGLHDLAWLPSSTAEIDARVRGIMRRRHRWTGMTSMICREIAHDMRSPLQALNFLVQAMDRQDTDNKLEADLEMLRRVVDTCEVLATSISNLGHHPLRKWAPVGEAPAEVELAQVLDSMAKGRFFRSRIDLQLGESLRVWCRPKLIQRALRDVLRVTYQRMPSSDRISVQGMSFGDEVVITVSAPVFPAFLEFLPQMASREAAVLLRRQRKPVPFAGLAYAQEAFIASGGTLAIRQNEDDHLEIEARLPRK